MLNRSIVAEGIVKALVMISYLQVNDFSKSIILKGRMRKLFSETICRHNSEVIFWGWWYHGKKVIIWEVNRPPTDIISKYVLQWKIFMHNIHIFTGITHFKFWLMFAVEYDNISSIFSRLSILLCNIGLHLLITNWTMIRDR